jgi:serine protease Do
MYGQVIGIATAKIVSERFEGMGFAIPSTDVKAVVDSIIKNSYVAGRVKIGITGFAVDSFTASQNNLPCGIRIDTISPKGPCDNTELQKNDIVTEVDGQKIESFTDIYRVLEEHKPNDKVKVKYYRPETQKYGEIEITLQEDVI